jgi:hypothetical protein
MARGASNNLQQFSTHFCNPSKPARHFQITKDWEDTFGQKGKKKPDQEFMKG